MSVITFEKLPVTTMTAVLTLKGSVNINQVFPLLEITRVPVGSFKYSKKEKLPFCSIPGSIISASFNGITRGISKNRASGGWRNSVMMDISSSKKNVNVKLSCKSIHMCGSDSEELCIETGKLVLDHIFKIQETLDYLQSLPKELVTKSIEWLKSNCRGSLFYVDARTDKIISIENGRECNNILVDDEGNPFINETHTIFTVIDGDTIDDNGQIISQDGYAYRMMTNKGKTVIVTYGMVKDSFANDDVFEEQTIPIHVIYPLYVYSIVIPEEYYKGLPKDVDQRMVEFLIRFAPDYRYYHEYTEFIDKVMTVERVYEAELAIDKFFPLMVNFSYPLGMYINRSLLSCAIDNKENFKVFFNNTTDHCVTAILPYVPTKQMNLHKKTKNNKARQHTFMIYQSGVVTQTGPNLKMVKKAYLKFNNLIRSVSHQITNPDNLFIYKVKIRKNRDPYVSLSTLNEPYYFETAQQDIPSPDTDYSSNLPMGIDVNNLDSLEDSLDEDEYPSIEKVFNLSIPSDLSDEKYRDFLDLLDMYWDTIGSADQNAQQFAALYNDLNSNEKIEFNVIDSLFTKHLKSLYTITPDQIRYIKSLGYIIVGQLFCDPDSIDQITEYVDIGDFLTIDSTSDPEIEQYISDLWKSFFSL